MVPLGDYDMAKTIAAWQPIKEDGERVQSIENVFMQNFNEQIDDAIADVSKEKPKEFTNKGDEIAAQIKADANRNVYTINGQVYDHQPADKVIPAFKNAVKGTANRQGISLIANQSMLNAISMLSNRAPLASTNKTPNGLQRTYSIIRLVAWP